VVVSVTTVKHRLQPPTVLVVDDDRDILETLHTLYTIALSDARVLTASDPAAALKMMEREDVDLIVTDYKMPGMTGVEFLERARAISPGVQTALISAFPEFALGDRKVAVAPVGKFFSKPIDTDALLRYSREALTR